MNELNIMSVNKMKITELKDDSFTVYRLLVTSYDTDDFEIHLYTHKGIDWFKELEEVIVDLEAHPDTLQGCIERLKKLVPLERIKWGRQT